MFCLVFCIAFSIVYYLNLNVNFSGLNFSVGKEIYIFFFLLSNTHNFVVSREFSILLGASLNCCTPLDFHITI